MPICTRLCVPNHGGLSEAWGTAFGWVQAGLSWRSSRRLLPPFEPPRPFVLTDLGGTGAPRLLRASGYDRIELPACLVQRDGGGLTWRRQASEGLAGSHAESIY